MKILLIDNHDSFTFNLVHQLQSLSDVSTDVVPVDQLTLNIADRYSRIVISPGPGLPSDRPVLKEIIFQKAQSSSILGVCLGHQAIAEAFGATLHRITPVFHGIAAKVEVLSDNARLFNGIQSGFEAGLYHSWAVSNDHIPDEIEITAVSEKGIIMALQHRKFDIHGVQFHPESIMTPLGKNIISNWLNH